MIGINKYSIIIIMFLMLTGCSSGLEISPVPSTQSPSTYPGNTEIYPSPIPPVQDFSVYPNSTQININLPPDPPTSAPQPQAGKGSVSGALYSYNMKIRIAGTLAYLTPAVGEKKDQVPSILTSPNPEQGDVYFTTDDKGNFELDNVSPGNYFLIVWSPYTWEVAQVSETDEKAMSIELQADQKTILGTVLVGWP